MQEVLCLTFRNKDIVKWKIGDEIDNLDAIYIVSKVNYSYSKRNTYQHIELTKKEVFING